MQTFHDRKADRLTLIQEGHPIVAWLVVIPLAGMMVYAAVVAWSAGGTIGALLALLCLVAAAIIAWVAAWVATAIVATFDGQVGVLTIRHDRPWGSRTRQVPFADVHDLATRSSVITVGAVDITLTNGRTVSLRSNRGDEVEGALGEARGMMRRPRAAAP